MKAAERILKALANRRRLVIVEYLLDSGPAYVERISQHLRISYKSTSRHVRILELGGIVIREQRSRYAFYACLHRPARLRRLLNDVLMFART